MPITNPLKTQAEVDAAYTKNMSTINQDTPPQPTAPAPLHASAPTTGYGSTLPTPALTQPNAPSSPPTGLSVTKTTVPITPAPVVAPAIKTYPSPQETAPKEGQVWDTTQKKWVAQGTAQGTAGKTNTDLQFGGNVGKEILQPTDKIAPPQEDLAALAPPQPKSTAETVASPVPLNEGMINDLYNQLLTGKITADSADWQALPYDLRKQAYQRWTDPNLILSMIKSGKVVPGDENWNRMEYTARRTAYQMWDKLNGAKTPGTLPDGSKEPTKPTTPTDAVLPNPDGTDAKLTYEDFITKQLNTLMAGNVEREKELKDAADSYTLNLAEIDDEIAKRKNNLLVDKNEIRDNPWITQGAVDRRTAMAEENAKGDLDLLIAQRNSATESYNVKVAAMNTTWDRQQNAVTQYANLAGQLETMKMNKEAVQINKDNKLKDDARSVIDNLYQQFGGQAFKTISSDMFALAGYDSVDTIALSKMLTINELNSKKASGGSMTDLQTYINATPAQQAMIREYNQSKAGGAVGTTPANITATGMKYDPTAINNLPADLQYKALNSSTTGAAAMAGEQFTQNADGSWSRTQNVIPYLGDTFGKAYQALIYGSDGKANPNARFTPLVGSLALFHAVDAKGVDVGHVGWVTSVGNGEFTVDETNYKPGEFSSGRTVKMDDAQLAGFYVPPNYKNEILGQYTQIDLLFDKAMQAKLISNANNVLVTPTQFVNSVFSGQKKTYEAESYVWNKLAEKEAVIAKMTEADRAKLIQTALDGSYNDSLGWQWDWPSTPNIGPKDSGFLKSTTLNSPTSAYKYDFSALPMATTKLPASAREWFYKNNYGDFTVWGDVPQAAMADYNAKTPQAVLIPPAGTATDTANDSTTPYIDPEVQKLIDENNS